MSNFISASEAASASNSIASFEICDTLTFAESRPSEKGRTTLLELPREGSVVELLPSNFSVRSCVNVYGGRSFTSTPDGIFFINGSDQGIYCLKEGAVTLLYQDNSSSFGDPIYDIKRKRLYSIQERHGEEHQAIVSLDLKSKELTTLVTGSNFYASLSLSPAGTELAWTEWNHPHMQWDESKVATLNLEKKVGGPTLYHAGTSAHSPTYLENGTLLALWDGSGYWNPYRVDGQKPLLSAPIECGDPLWQFGSRPMTQIGSSLYCIGREKGGDVVIEIDLKSHVAKHLSIPLNTIQAIARWGQQLIVQGASATHGTCLMTCDPKSSAHTTLYPKEISAHRTLSYPRAIEFINRHGDPVYGYFTPARGIDQNAPLIVKCHSGPTSRVTSDLNMQAQFFASHGYAFLEINYGGSTGYGKAYRERMRGAYGAIDVTDTIDATQYVIKQGWVDSKKIAIYGSSSGGMTALLAAAESSLYSHIVVLYPVIDPLALTEHTHNFEKYYFDGLIGPLPEYEKRYIDRSPMHRASEIKVPTLIFHGEKDPVVPIEQSTQFERLLYIEKTPVTLITFEDEGHSFKSADAKAAVLNKTLEFLK